MAQAQPGAGRQQQRVILWFRNDLRLTDNPILHEAAQLVRKSLASEVRDAARVIAGHGHLHARRRQHATY